MADTTVATSVSSFQDLQGMFGPYWIDKDIGIIIYSDTGQDLTFARTTDAGASWTPTQIESGSAFVISSWFDQETPGDSGTLLHITWLDALDDEAKYVSVDISDGSVGTIRTIDSGITVATLGENRTSITKTVSGNLIVAFSTQTEIECYKSSDNFATAGTAIADPFETATEEDWLLLYPANTGDDNDACGIFWDRSANVISAKMYDDSENLWDESTIDVFNNNSATYINMDASVRHSDNHILLAAHSAHDFSGDDLRTYDINPNSISSPIRTDKTNIFTDQVESAQCAVIINQQNDDVYVAYLKGGTWLDSTDIVFHKSDDGMGTWGSEQAYNETTDDNRLVHGGRTVGNSGGRIQWSWYNDDNTDIFVNLVNDIEISATGGDPTITPSALSLTLVQPTPTIDLISNPTITPSSLALNLTQQTPTVGVFTSITVTPSSLGLTATEIDPTINIISNQTILPSALSLTLTQPTLTLDIISDAIITPNSLSLTLAQLTPTIDLNLDFGQSKSIDFNNGIITTATMTVTFTGNTPSLLMTADGTNWEAVTSGVAHTFTNTGTDLKWRIVASGTTVTQVTVEDYH